MAKDSYNNMDLLDLAEAYKKNAEIVVSETRRLVNKDIKAAGRKARKAAQENVHIAKALRKEVTEYVNSL